MSEIDRLAGDSDWIDLEFVERERTPEQITELGIQLHLADSLFGRLAEITEYVDGDTIHEP